jgi:hypothetical protein
MNLTPFLYIIKALEGVLSSKAIDSSIAGIAVRIMIAFFAILIISFYEYGILLHFTSLIKMILSIIAFFASLIITFYECGILLHFTSLIN